MNIVYQACLTFLGRESDREMVCANKPNKLSQPFCVLNFFDKTTKIIGNVCYPQLQMARIQNKKQ